MSRMAKCPNCLRSIYVPKTGEEFLCKYCGEQYCRDMEEYVDNLAGISAQYAEGGDVQCGLWAGLFHVERFDRLFFDLSNDDYAFLLRIDGDGFKDVLVVNYRQAERYERWVESLPTESDDQDGC